MMRDWGLGIGDAIYMHINKAAGRDARRRGLEETHKSDTFYFSSKANI